MTKWWKMFTGNHKGFSLVELICAVAILSIVITGAGSAMVISARSYQRGSSELDLQQQAQITANLLTNLIIDADIIETPPNVGDELGELSVIKQEMKALEDGSQTIAYYRYTVTPNAASQLIYTRQEVTVNADGTIVTGGTTAETSVLAEHMDADAFRVKRIAENNVDFTLKVLGTDGRTFESDYHVTRRNGVSGSTGSSLTGTGRILVEEELVLEPNQDYKLNVRIIGTSILGYKTESINGTQGIPVTGNTSSETKVTFVDNNTINIRVGKTETGSGIESMFCFDIQANDGDIAPTTVKVYVRRVNAMGVNEEGELRGSRTSGSVNKAGGYYKVPAPLIGPNLDKRLGAWYDADYVNPYAVKWSYVFTIEDEEGNISYPAYTDYIEVVAEGIEDNEPYVIFKLKQNMTAGCKLTVTATALHPLGINPDKIPDPDPNEPTPKKHWSNKSGLLYGNVEASWTLEYQAWRRNGKLDITVPVTDRDYDFYPDGTCLYKYRDDANVRFIGYDINNNVIVDQQFNPWTSSQNSLLNANVDKAQVDKVWDLVLNVTTDYGDRYYGYSSYSTPYLVAGIRDQYGNAANPYSWSDVDISGNSPIDAQYRYIYTGLGRTDVVRYVVEVTYGYEDESGTKHVETITSEHSVENVSIRYRSSLSAKWTRNNIIYVTTDDQITDYKVYFKFDTGWDGKNYFFHDLERFVGVIHDDEDDMKDQRRDIAVIQDPILRTNNHPQTDESTYLTFHLDAADKEECKRLSEEYGGVIKEVFEYNPYLDMLNKVETGRTEITPGYVDENNVWHPAEYDIQYAVSYPSYSGTQVTHDLMQKMTGCSGIVEFHFVEPNIEGATLKTRYCPTPGEFTVLGNMYYLSSPDTEIKIICNGNTAIYQEVSGGTTTTVNLTWDGTSKWIAN